MKDTKPRNIAEGEFTYGERIMLMRIMKEDMGDYERIKEIIQLLHDIEPEPQDAVNLTEYVAQIIKDFGGWLEREQRELFIPPTPEEERAGIKQLSDACGDMGNVVTLAEEFKCSFEEVYKKPYPEVFTILKVRTERAKYERRLSKEMLRKK